MFVFGCPDVFCHLSPLLIPLPVPPHRCSGPALSLVGRIQATHARSDTNAHTCKPTRAEPRRCWQFLDIPAAERRLNVLQSSCREVVQVSLTDIQSKTKNKTCICFTIKASAVLRDLWAFPHLKSKHNANSCDDAMFVEALQIFWPCSLRNGTAGRKPQGSRCPSSFVPLALICSNISSSPHLAVTRTACPLC